MAHTTHPRLPAVAALVALPASLVAMLLAAAQIGNPVISWAVSSVALVVALVVFTVGECAWENTLSEARAAGLVAR